MCDAKSQADLLRRAATRTLLHLFSCEMPVFYDFAGSSVLVVDRDTLTTFASTGVSRKLQSSQHQACVGYPGALGARPFLLVADALGILLSNLNKLL
ncbi:unnamed protein product [Schistocephalus solidus]|uniref:Uncharacterized protein n=1 Tax=Schistocephalus solidus TaxID=70667 RepID=A0A183TM42_SCHSO|nr:unnamed protein product [Schistocephalus solidus]